MTDHNVDNEAIAAAVETALDPDTFDVLAYLDNQPVAEDHFDIYVNLPAAKRLHKLLVDRQELLAKRREAEKRGEASSLSISDDDEDTEFDDEINGLVQECEKSKITIFTRSVAPALRKAIDARYVAKADRDWPVEKRQEHDNRRVADVLSRAIVRVENGRGQVDNSEWNADRVIKMEEKLHESQGQKFIAGLTSMVYTGDVFEEALTADFS